MILKLNVPSIGDLCGQCSDPNAKVVAQRWYVTGWTIPVCENCLRPDEKIKVNEMLDDSLYRSGVRK